MLLFKLLFFIPLFSTVITYPAGLLINDRASQIVSSSLISISAIVSWLCLYNYISNDLSPFVIDIFSWILISGSYLDWSIAVNPLTLLMLTLVLTVSALVHIYSIEYMSHDKSKNRFMVYLSLFTFCMVSLVVSDNLVYAIEGLEGTDSMINRVKDLISNTKNLNTLKRCH